jgi:nitroimidazol reductase NimA-like FMN-containing flavoprotein (pyridoxamine 5'-phosphate oxidase superfamily)
MITDLTNSECERILTSNRYGHLGCSDGDEPYVVPITYVYKDGFLYSFTHEGQKIELMRKNPKMCVQVEHIASEKEWESVMCWGLFEEVTDEKSIQDVKLLFAEQHGESVLAGEEPAVSPMVEKLHLQNDISAVLYRMKPYRMTGRAMKV